MENNFIEGLDNVAKAEFNRLWGMRETLSQVNDVTKPILAQYCCVFSKVRHMTVRVQSLEGDALSSCITELAKLQKVMLEYSKILKLNEKTSVKKSKFYDLLVNND